MPHNTAPLARSLRARRNLGVDLRTAYKNACSNGLKAGTSHSSIPAARLKRTLRAGCSLRLDLRTAYKKAAGVDGTESSFNGNTTGPAYATSDEFGVLLPASVSDPSCSVEDI